LLALLAEPVCAWRARTLAEYQNLRITQVISPETADGAAGAVVDDAFGTGGTAVELAEGVKLRFGTDVKDGVSAVWIYARVPGSRVSGPWPPVYLEMLVEKPSGERVRSRQRIPYQPMYQEVTRLFFVAPSRGTHRITLALGKHSRSALLLDRIEIRDELDGCQFKPLKKERSGWDDVDAREAQTAPKKRQKLPEPLLESGARAAEMAELLGKLRQSLPPVNALLGGCDGMTPELKELAESQAKGKFSPTTLFEPWALVDPETGKRYDAASYEAVRLYEGGLPDDGGGSYVPEGQYGVTGRARTIASLAPFFLGRLSALLGEAEKRSLAHIQTGNPAFAREGPQIHAALAERHPTLSLNVQDMFRTFGLAYYERFGQCSGNPLPPLRLARVYDRLFDVIAKDRELARATGEHIPCVRKPKELRAFFDRNILQYGINLCFRFSHLHQQFGWERRMANLLCLFGPNEISQKFMDRFFRQCFADLTGDGGYQDYLINGTNRDGANYIGSSGYTLGVPANLAEISMALEDFVRRGGRVPRFAYDPAVNPRLHEAGGYYLRFRSAGGFHCLYGDGGQHSDHRFDTITWADLAPAYRWFFRHTRDPHYAWLARRLGRRPGVPDEEWRSIEAAAEEQKSPVLHRGSAVMTGFGSTSLDLGPESEDPRHKGAARLRHGGGRGHAHGDLLDLSLFAYHSPMISDGGRCGWPWLRLTAQHNVVEVDRASFQATGVNSGAYGYPIMVCDLAGVKFMSAGGWCSTHPDLRDFRRDVALIDLGPHAVKEQLLRHYYVFDLQRVGGGKVHTYCAHSMWCESIEHNVKSTPAPDGPESLLHGVGDPRGGRTVNPFVTTWRGYHRGRFAGKGLRHHLFGWGNLPFYTGACYGVRVPFLWVERESKEQMRAVYPAVYEPFFSEPNLTSIKALKVTGAGEGSRGAAAVEVLSRWGRKDLVITNESGRRISVEGGIVTDGHYAFLAADDDGLAQATLVGGTTLSRGKLRLEAEKPAYEGTVASFDPRTLELKTNPPLPADPRLNGSLVSFGREPHRAGETIAVRDGKVFLERWPLIFRSPIRRVDEAASAVLPEISPPLTAAEPRHYWGCTATNAAHDRFWRVERTEVTEMWFPLFTPISEEDVTDADGDGRRTVKLTDFAVPWLTRDPVILYYGPFFKGIRMKQFSREPFKEPLVLEVLRIDSGRRALYFKPPRQDYDLVWNEWVYDATMVTNEGGNRQWRGNVPAREFRLVLSGGEPVTDAAFTEARLPWGEEPDGQCRIFLYDFGPGDPYRLETYVSARRAEGGLAVECNVKESVHLPKEETP